jgi:transposase, IS5 family
MMFKILVIQAQNNRSDERTEFLINDRLSFMRFLGLSVGERVPDAKTIWLFRERLTRAGTIEKLFDRFRPRGRLYCHVGSDRGREPHRCAEAAQHRCREGGYQGWPHPAGLKQKPGKAPSEGPQRALDCEFSKAKPRADGTTPVDIAIPTFGYQTHISTDRRHGRPATQGFDRLTLLGAHF